MTTDRVAPLKLTRSSGFHYVANDQGEQAELFQIPAGLSGDYALSHASALESCVLDALDKTISGGGTMDANLAMLCHHALETAIGLRFSVGAAM